MGRTVCLVTDGPAETYFVGRLHADVGVDLVVVVERAPMRRRVVRAGSPSALYDVLLERFANVRRKRERNAELDRWLGDRWRSLPQELRRIRVRSTSDAAVLDEIRRLGDVYLVVHASALVDMKLINECIVALNLHWGLSPYYRGTHCTDWALLHCDTRNIGVTIHELTETIDGGRIIGQRRARLTPGDTAHSIDAQLTCLGTELVGQALRILHDGGSLAGAPQDLSRGHITFRRQWSRHLRRQVARMERAGLAAALARPTRPELPIVHGPTHDLGSDGERLD